MYYGEWRDAAGEAAFFQGALREARPAAERIAGNAADQGIERYDQHFAGALQTEYPGTPREHPAGEYLGLNVPAASATRRARLQAVHCDRGKRAMQIDLRQRSDRRGSAHEYLQPSPSRAGQGPLTTLDTGSTVLVSSTGSGEEDMHIGRRISEGTGG